MAFGDQNGTASVVQHQRMHIRIDTFECSVPSVLLVLENLEPSEGSIRIEVKSGEIPKED
jgi:hypothetical protein